MSSQKNSRFLFKGGIVVTMDSKVPNLATGDVLVADGRIAAVCAVSRPSSMPAITPAAPSTPMQHWMRSTVPASVRCSWWGRRWTRRPPPRTCRRILNGRPRRAPCTGRSTRVGAFLDIAYSFAGPAAGFIPGRFGYAAVYLLGAASAVLGAALVAISRTRES